MQHIGKEELMRIASHLSNLDGSKKSKWEKRKFNKNYKEVGQRSALNCLILYLLNRKKIQGHIECESISREIIYNLPFKYPFLLLICTLYLQVKSTLIQLERLKFWCTCNLKDKLKYFRKTLGKELKCKRRANKYK